MRLAAFAVGALAALPFAAEAASDVATVHGRVVDVHGRPFPAFPLRITESGRRIHLRTDKDGTFTALGLTPGKVVVQLEGAGYAQDRAVCDIPVGMTARVELTVRRPIGLGTMTCRMEPLTQDMTVIR